MDTNTISKLIEKQLPRLVPTNIKEIKGRGRRRPNSWTYKIATMQGDKVVKVIKPLRRHEVETNIEKVALESIREGSLKDVVCLEDSGELYISKMEKLSFLVFPFVSGNDLEKDLSEKDGGNEKDAHDLLSWLIERIEEISELGIIHQDIKPANIISSKDGYVLIDLGIARFIDLDKNYIKQQGPVGYLSPEQVALGQERKTSNKHRVTYMSDIYSAAVCSLEVALGSKEFKKVWAVDERHMASSKIREGSIPIKNNKLKEMLAVCLEYEPSVRYKTAVRRGYLAPDPPLLSLPPLWLLHYSTTGHKYIVDFAKDNSKIKNGAVFLSEYITSLANIEGDIKKIKDCGWQVIIDPSTYKIPFGDVLEPDRAELNASKAKNPDDIDEESNSKEKIGNIAFRDRPYFHERLLERDFIPKTFKEEFITSVIEFQRQFAPTCYVSPYFFIDSPTCSALEVTLDLFAESKEMLEDDGDDTPLMLGLALSKNIIKDAAQRLLLLDQLFMRPGVDAIFLRPELDKNDNSPVSDPEYLAGILEIAEILSVDKSLLLVQTDQSSLGIISNKNISTDVSIAISPDVRVRKNKIQDKVDGVISTGFSLPEHRQYKYYIPELLNDLDVSRQLDTRDMREFISKNKLQCKCRYCEGIDLKEYTSLSRNMHFASRFSDQVNDLYTSPEGHKEFKKMIDDAEGLYVDIKKRGIVLSDESGGAFLPVWKKIFTSK